MKRTREEDHFDIVDMARSYMEIPSLEPNISSMLAVEIEMKIRAILQEARKIMSHAKRKILFTEDITNAMAILNVPRILGYQSALTNYTYTKAPAAGRREWYHAVKDVSLQEYCSEPITEIPHRPAYHFHWLALKGEQPFIPENVSETAPAPSGMPTASPIPAKIMEPKPKFPHLAYKTEDITKELMSFYELFMSGVAEQLKLIRRAKYLTTELFTSQFQQTLCTIRTEPSIKSIVPHILNYLLWLSKDHEELLECQFCVLVTLHQILLNPYLEVDQHLHIVMILVMTILLSACSVTDDLPNIIHIKTYAGKLLGLTCKRYEQKYSTIVSNSLHLISKVILDPNSLMDSLFGAIQASLWLGGKVTEKIILPHLDYLHSRLSNLDRKQPTILALGGQCLTSLIMATVSMLKEIGDTYMGESECMKIYNKVSETLDDVLILYMHRILPPNLNQDNPLDCFL